MSVKFLLFRGGVLGGGGKCRFYFYGRADFSELRDSKFTTRSVFTMPPRSTML